MDQADGFVFRKYGEKIVGAKRHAVTRSYFRCTANDCHAKKRVDKLLDAPPDAKPLAVLQIGQHNHQPRHKPRLAPFSLAAAAAAAGAASAEDGCSLLPGLVLPEDCSSAHPEGHPSSAQGDAPSARDAPACWPSSGSGPKQRLFLEWDRLRAEDIAAAMYRDLRRQLVHEDAPQHQAGAPAQAPPLTRPLSCAPSGAPWRASSLFPPEHLPALHAPAEGSNRLRSPLHPQASNGQEPKEAPGLVGESAPDPSISTSLSDLGRPGRLLGAAGESMESSQFCMGSRLQQEMQRQAELEAALRQLRACAKPGAHCEDAAALERLVEGLRGAQGPPGPTWERLQSARSDVSATLEAQSGALSSRAEVGASWSAMSSMAEVPGTRMTRPTPADLHAFPQQTLRPASGPALQAPDRGSGSMACFRSAVQTTRGGFEEAAEAAAAHLDCPDLGELVFQECVAASGVGAQEGGVHEVQARGVPLAARLWEDQSCTMADDELEYILRSCGSQPFDTTSGGPLEREWGESGEALDFSDSAGQVVHLVDLPALAFETGCHDLLMRLT